MLQFRNAFLGICLFATTGDAFQSPSITGALRPSSIGLKAGSRENWTFNPLDMDDLSPIDTLLRRGVIPLGIRLFNEEKYEDAVVNYMKKDGCDRATAQRNMDAFFNDPNGWVVNQGRMRDLGEDYGDINAKTGVQKRPVFSTVWAVFTFWAFFIFFPGRIAELGGVNPSLPDNGYCSFPVQTVDGLKCKERKGFQFNSIINDPSTFK